MKLVCTGFSKNTDDAPGKAAIFGVVTVRLHAELLNGVRIWRGVSRVAEPRQVRSSVEVIIHGSRATVRSAIDQRVLFRITENNAVVIALHARSDVE